MQIIEAMTGPDSPGEERLIQTLAGELDDAYTLFRRVLLPRATDAIDTVLVGPFGVLVITTHEYAGTYACEGDEWFHSPDGGQSWQLSTENPIKQALYDHIQLKSYLAREGLHGVPLEKAVVFTNPKTNLIPQRPAARLFGLRELQQYARQLTGQAYLTPARVEDVVAALRRTIKGTVQARTAEVRAAPATRRAGRSPTTWLLVLGIALLGISATCFTLALVLLVQNLV